MARNLEDGAEADPEGRTTPSINLSDGAPDQPAPAVGQGEPSWPEDPEALRVEALSEEGAGLKPPLAYTEDEASVPERPDDSSAPILTEDLGSPDPLTPSVPNSTSSTDAFATAGAGVSEDRTFEAADQREAPAVGFTRDERTFEASAHGASASKPYPTGVTPGPLAPPPTRRGGAGALLLGGATAAALGFGAAWLARDRLESAPAGLSTELEERLAALEARPLPDDTEVQSLAERLSEAETRLEALEEAPVPVAETLAAAPTVDLDPLREEVAAGLAQAEERAAGLEERLAALEARPAEAQGGTPAAGPALRRPDEPDAGTEAVADLEPRLAAIESGTTRATAALLDVQAGLEALRGRVEASEATLAEFETRLGEAPAATEAALSELRTALEALRDSVGTNDTALAEIDARLDEAEARLGEAEAAGASAAEEARAAADLLAESQSRAEAAEAQARREAALVALDVALDAGEPLGALPDLGTEPPEALVRAAEKGVPSLASLRESFPDAARAGLAAARSEGLVEEGGVMGFLRGQLSVRSTAPREGGDPDAVLSRAEAALASGRLDATLAELQTLPEPVQAAMVDWTAQARARVEAEAALAALRGAEPGDAPAD